MTTQTKSERVIAGCRVITDTWKTLSIDEVSDILEEIVRLSKEIQQEERARCA
jgi:hypothetical protein